MRSIFSPRSRPSIRTQIFLDSKEKLSISTDTQEFLLLKSKILSNLRR